MQKKSVYRYVMPLMLIAAIMVGFNHYLIMSMKIVQAKNGLELTGDLSQDSVMMVIHEGMPDIYGAELGVLYENTQAAIDVMKQFDPGYGANKIVLTDEKLQRYIDVTTKISCEFCCGAASITFADGRAACGCAHSQAMRGLAAYLLQNHAESYTNDELLRELSRWKGRYFPKQMIKKVSDQVTSGQFTPDIASLLIGIDVSEYAGATVPAPSEIQGLPDMVGGC